MLMMYEWHKTKDLQFLYQNLQLASTRNSLGPLTTFANVLILYPTKTPENQSFCGDFGPYKMVTVAKNGLKYN